MLKGDGERERERNVRTEEAHLYKEKDGVRKRLGFARRELVVGGGVGDSIASRDTG